MKRSRIYHDPPRIARVSYGELTYAGWRLVMFMFSISFAVSGEYDIAWRGATKSRRVLGGAAYDPSQTLRR